MPISKEPTSKTGLIKDVNFDNDPGLKWLKQQYSNNWRTYIPALSEMPKNWPGEESEDGLRTEHLTPDYWGSFLYHGPRDANGRLNAPQVDDDEPPWHTDDVEMHFSNEAEVEPDQPDQTEEELSIKESEEDSNMKSQSSSDESSSDMELGDGHNMKLQSSSDESSSDMELGLEDRNSDEDQTLNVAKKVTGILILPTKEIGGSVLPSKPTTRDHERIIREFFVNLASLLNHVNVRAQTAHLQAFYQGIQQMALHSKYPEKEWLMTLIKSSREEDQKLLKQTRRCLVVLDKQNDEDWEALVREDVTKPIIDEFRARCHEYLTYIEFGH